MDHQKGSSTAPPIAVRILSVPADPAITVRFRGQITGLIVHWCGKASVPCDGPEKCPVSIHRKSITWKGYAPAEHWDATRSLWIPVVFEVTEGIENVLRGRKIRGEQWCFRRAVYGDVKSPVVGLFCSTDPEDTVRPSFDVHPVLSRVYHKPTLLLGVENPFQPRLFLEAGSGQEPTVYTYTYEAEKAKEPATRAEWDSFRKALNALKGR